MPSANHPRPLLSLTTLLKPVATYRTTPPLNRPTSLSYLKLALSLILSTILRVDLISRRTTAVAASRIRERRSESLNGPKNAPAPAKTAANIRTSWRQPDRSCKASPFPGSSATPATQDEKGWGARAALRIAARSFLPYAELTASDSMVARIGSMGVTLARTSDIFPLTG